MMEVLNHDITVFNCIGKLQQQNYGFTQSGETANWLESLSFYNALNSIRTKAVEPRFPECLVEASVRNTVKDKLGRPIRISEEPWKALQTRMNGLLSSFLSMFGCIGSRFTAL